MTKTEKERERRETPDGYLGQGDFTFSVRRVKDKKKRGGASVKETWPILDIPNERSISQKYSSLQVNTVYWLLLHRAYATSPPQCTIMVKSVCAGRGLHSNLLCPLETGKQTVHVFLNQMAQWELMAWKKWENCAHIRLYIETDALQGRQDRTQAC